MNCLYCGAAIPRGHHGEDRWRERRYCSKMCNRSAIAEAQRERALEQFQQIEDLFAKGLNADQVLEKIGLNRKAALDKCLRYGRPDLNHQLRKGEPPVLRKVEIVHGTDAAYHAHHQRNERPCTRCRRAHATASVVREAVRAAKTGHGPRQISNPNDEDWGQAACTGDDDPDAWFPDEGDWRRAAYAKLTCYTQCPLRDACLVMALEAAAKGKDWAKWGIFGGLGAAERGRLKRKPATA